MFVTTQPPTSAGAGARGTIGELVGSPSLPQSDQIPNEEMGLALHRLRELLFSHGVALDTVEPVPARELYRFIVEELFEVKVDLPVPAGSYYFFLYEEVNPTPETKARWSARHFALRMLAIPPSHDTPDPWIPSSVAPGRYRTRNRRRLPFAYLEERFELYRMSTRPREIESIVSEAERIDPHHIRVTVILTMKSETNDPYRLDDEPCVERVIMELDDLDGEWLVVGSSLI